MAEKTDAVELLTADHRKIERLFSRYESTADLDERTRVAHEAVHDLAVHGEIEELLFYPRLRQALPDGDRLADEAVDEHVGIKETLNAVDGMTAHDAPFDRHMRELMAEVRHHVEEEERDLFPAVRQALGDGELRDLGGRLEQARAIVPTRPHPGAPTSPVAKLAAGAPTALVDRVRDALRRAGG